MKRKNFMSIMLIGAVACSVMACGSKTVENAKIPETKQVETSTTAVETKETVSVNDSTEEKSADIPDSVDTQDGVDTQVGLLTTKIGQGIELSEEQKTVIEYFDNDYFEVADYKFLQRYPQVFEGAQIHCVAEIEKVLSATNEEYQALALVYDTVSYMADRGEYGEDYTNENYIVVNGKQQGIERVIEGDVLQIYGRYSSVDSYTIDGTDKLLPTINLYDSSYINDQSRFSPSFIKNVAKIIFGSNIEVRNAVPGEDYTDTEIAWKFDYDPYMICELENQTNAKFTKFRFYTERGRIDDAKSASSEPDLDVFTTNIVREIQFAPDFQHFWLFTYDTDLKTLSLDYYDTSFNKIWNREFEETENAVYDYTESAIYLVANNDYYAISLADGQDIVDPAFVGEKKRVAKIEDGVLLVSNSTSDTVMKVGLDGSILWKTNTTLAAENIEGIQRINGYIVIELSGGWDYLIINEADGSLVGEITG